MYSKTTFYVLLFFITGLSACSKSGVNPGKGENLVLTTIDQQKVSSDNAFSLKLFKNLDSANMANANLFVSPLSVSFAMGMTANGSSGQTLTAINNAMDFNGYTQNEINTYYQTLITDLPKLDPNTTLKIANSIWYQQSFSVLTPFLQTNISSYDAKVQGLDFSSPSAVSTINNWVNSETNGAIPTIINEIPSNDVMYLVNAIYFKSIWKEKFDASKTSKQTFYLADNSTVQTDFMDGTVDFNRYDDANVSVFELPYSNDKFSLVIAMPASGKTLTQMVAGLDSTKWKTWMAGLNGVKTEIKLPKYKFSYNVNLNNSLTALGMGIAFGNTADFTRINATTPLLISKVVQQAYVDVDETGTTAAAATSVAVGLTAVANPPPAVIDHPFMFAIRQVNSGLIMFAGVVNNPLTP